MPIFRIKVQIEIVIRITIDKGIKDQPTPGIQEPPNMNSLLGIQITQETIDKVINILNRRLMVLAINNKLLLISYNNYNLLDHKPINTATKED